MSEPDDADRSNAATASERAVALVALAVPLVLLVWLHWAVVAEWQTSRELAHSGVAVTASVVGVEAADVPRSDGYRVTYRYEVVHRDGTTSALTATSAIDRATYDSVVVGGTVVVRYDRDQPTRVAVARNDRLATMIFVTLLVDGAVVAAGVVIARTSRAG